MLLRHTGVLPGLLVYLCWTFVTPSPVPAGVVVGTVDRVQINTLGDGLNVLGDRGNEPSLAVDPTFPNGIVACWRDFDDPSGDVHGAWARSLDGGRTWTAPQLLSPTDFRSDPVMAVDANGRFYFCSLRYDAPNLLGDLWSSDDGRLTFASPVPMFPGDKPWIEVDRTGGPGHDNIYCAWEAGFTRSTDGGASFDAPLVLPDFVRFGTVDVAPDGTVVIVGIPGNDLTQFTVSRSINAWDANQTPVFNNTTFSLGGDFGYPIGGTSQPNPLGLLGQPWILVDRSRGTGSDHVYVLCSVNPPGPDPMDVYFARSTDGGATFGTPIRVNQDAAMASSWQWYGVMSVAPNGRIDVVWNDTSESLTQNLSRLYYSCSTDGGLNWSAGQVISPQWDSHLGWGNFASTGEYHDMESDDVGAHLVWTATFNGEQDVYYSRIGDYDCNANGVGDATDITLGTSLDDDSNGIPDECDNVPTSVPQRTAYRLHANSPNPFNPTTTIRFEVPEGGAQVELFVFDASGRRVTTLVDGFVAGGSRDVRWNGTDTEGHEVASGVYYYRLLAQGVEETRKMVLAR